jgi:hypothetical protein
MFLGLVDVATGQGFKAKELELSAGPPTPCDSVQFETVCRRSSCSSSHRRPPASRTPPAGARRPPAGTPPNRPAHPCGASLALLLVAHLGPEVAAHRRPTRRPRPPVRRPAHPCSAPPALLLPHPGGGGTNPLFQRQVPPPPPPYNPACEVPPWWDWVRPGRARASRVRFDATLLNLAI